MRKLESWWELPGSLYRLFDIAPPHFQHEKFPQFFAQLDAGFWTALE
jgi:hypothetical protein